MASLLYFFFFFFLSFCSDRASSAVVCETATCAGSGPSVRFPFRFKDQAESCGYPGFDLSCNDQGRIVLNLPHSGDFYVQEIDYFQQVIYIADPENCFPRRVLENFSVSGSPFQLFFPGNFTFFNCSSGVRMPRSWPIPCISGFDNMVWMTTADDVENLSIPSSCRALVSALLPLSPPGTVQLAWVAPSCYYCEVAGRHCVRKNDRSVDVECSGEEDPSSNGGVPRSVKYGITIGLGIPGLLCLVGLSCYLCGRVRVRRREPQPDAELSSMIIPHRSVLAMGLDRTTIESFPKTLLGASRRLPNPSDNTCPICLSEYQPKEELRTIPECNHYFHANCIDEWLKLNATCPLCRKSPDESSSVTSSSSRTSSATASLPTP